MTTQWTDDHFVGGDVALDFANTVYRRTPEVGADLLDSVEDLVGWFAHAGLLPSGEGGSPALLREARRLRGLLWDLLEARGDVPAETLAGLLDLSRAGPVSVTADGVVTARTAEGACAAVALHGVRLALSPPPRGVRSCDRCGWYFLDTSRGRRRRWCSMKTCGNQSKAARFRATHH